MARGMPKSINDKIEEIDSKIEDFQTKINNLKVQRKELVEADRQAKLGALLEILVEKGLSVEEAIEKLNK